MGGNNKIATKTVMTSSQISTDSIIVGGGLSGLACALLLIEQGRSVQVLEASDRPGGRIRSAFDDADNTYLGDLGPTWIWPAYQPVIRRWIDKLSLSIFDQFTEGYSIFDNGPASDPEPCFLPKQDGSARFVGGSQAIIDELLRRLPKGVVRTRSPVRSVSVEKGGVRIHVGNENAPVMTGRRAVIALPPRIAAQTITWPQDFPAALMEGLNGIPTWMAPHAKAVAVYEKPFWREIGLSGRIASRFGPFVEAHDHSGPKGSPAAIFGFIGWPHDDRKTRADTLTAEVIAQLKRCFGPNNPAPVAVHIADWAADPLIATPDDLGCPMTHPEVGPDLLRQHHYSGRLWFAGAETALQSPGLIEGALAAAEGTAERIAAFTR